ncbi:hypothetical protein SDC9_78469 [bioreactor metagenome]|uniref:Uncharacterized protein n=1 Tax=bioreactor metagenome TaxID=1076179 RepID=A0A644YTM5_9ZZZZ|nr:spore coat associated protein CotJA [Candidatus Metalachnospira sp.]
MEVLVKNLLMSDINENNIQESDMNGKDIMMSTPAVKLINDSLIEEMGLAQAYVPVQNWEEPMGDMNSLTCGTVFGMLVMPYVKGSSLARNQEVC